MLTFNSPLLRFTYIFSFDRHILLAIWGADLSKGPKHYPKHPLLHVYFISYQKYCLFLSAVLSVCSSFLFISFVAVFFGRMWEKVVWYLQFLALGAKSCQTWIVQRRNWEKKNQNLNCSKKRTYFSLILSMFSIFLYSFITEFWATRKWTSSSYWPLMFAFSFCSLLQFLKTWLKPICWVPCLSLRSIS